MALPHLSSEQQSIDCAFAQLKEGRGFEPVGSGKIFTRMAGLLVAPDLEAYKWIKANTSPEFFNEHVVRILYSRSDRFSRKI
jgi:hypothetical protein